MKNKSFIFREEWKAALSTMTDHIRLEVYEAVIDYALYDIMPDMEATAMLAFHFIKTDIDDDRKKTEEIRRKRVSAGRKGGAPKGNHNAAKQPKTTKNKQNKQMVVLSEKTINNEEKPKPQVIVNKIVTNKNKQKQAKQAFGCFGNYEELKEKPPVPPDKEKTPRPLKEIIPPLSPKESTTSHNARVRAFVKPTVEEVKAFIEANGYDIDPFVFWNFYETNGWVQGRQQKPIKDWKACVRTWLRTKNNYAYGRNQPGYQQNQHPTDQQLAADTLSAIESLAAQRRQRNQNVRQ